MVQPLWKIVWRFLKKFKIEQPDDSEILGTYLKNMKILTKKMCIPMFTTALLIILKTWKQPRGVSTDEQTKKL